MLFRSIFMYLDEVPEGQTRDDLAIIIEEMLKQRMQGIKNEKGVYITPAFPKIIYALDEDNIHVLMQKENILASMRSGGDEFICWVETPLSNQEYEERLKGLLGDIKDAIQQETNCADVSLSIGATSSLVSGRDYVTMREDAYKSLYYVKKNGKNSIDVYSNGKVTANIPEAAVEHDLERSAAYWKRCLSCGRKW